MAEKVLCISETKDVLWRVLWGKLPKDRSEKDEELELLPPTLLMEALSFAIGFQRKWYELTGEWTTIDWNIPCGGIEFNLGREAARQQFQTR